jgi:hypothetical protein
LRAAIEKLTKDAAAVVDFNGVYRDCVQPDVGEDTIDISEAVHAGAVGIYSDDFAACVDSCNLG